MEQVQKSKVSRQEPATTEEPSVPASRADLSITDDLLDEIDSVLEENAEEFVNSYRQRGGQ